MQNIAVEVFCEDNRPYFFSFRTVAAVDKLFRRLKSIKPKLQAALIYKVGLISICCTLSECRKLFFWW